LLGHPLLGRIEADRAGHAMHAALVSRLLRDHSLWEFATLPAEGYEPVHAGAFGGAAQTV
jgi:UDP-3-O-[3-hydroxymyristoyl] N-acetylglucosamine deacetylase